MQEGATEVGREGPGMIQKDKWLPGVTPRDGVTTVARRAVGQRLRAVDHFLPLAAKRWHEDAEYVHQLRVSTRRSVAALDAFALTTRPRKRNWMRRQLRHLRRAAGDARDLDVLAAQIAKSKDLPGDARELYLETIADHRAVAQKPILERFRTLKDKNFAGKIERLLRSVRWRGPGTEPSLREFALRVLSPHMEHFLEQSAGDLSTFDRLHALRIEGKRVRYAIELLSAGFAPELRLELYPQIEMLQEKLGIINDCASASQRSRRWLQQVPDQSRHWEQLNALQDAAAAQAVADFHGWWNADRVAEFGRLWQRLRDIEPV
jgi:CHAD domain-containing protein